MDASSTDFAISYTPYAQCCNSLFCAVSQMLSSTVGVYNNTDTFHKARIRNEAKYIYVLKRRYVGIKETPLDSIYEGHLKST